MNERMKQILRNPTNRRLYEQERLIVWATEIVARAMKTAGKSKADMARDLETTPSHITQVLGGSRNMTLRTLANLAFSCDSRVRVDFEPLKVGEYFEHPVRLVRYPQPKKIAAQDNPERPVPDNYTLVA
ncbi:MAG: hypothetical protein ACREMK_02035 [Gemmatimonadota bacterium]